MDYLNTEKILNTKFIESGYDSLLQNSNSNQSFPETNVSSNCDADTPIQIKQTPLINTIIASTKACLKSFDSSKPNKLIKSSENKVYSKNELCTKFFKTPAFKIDYSFNSPSPKRPISSSTVTRPGMNSFNLRLLDIELNAVKPIQQKQDILQLLINNHHLPNNPEFLIGRQMGLDNIDIISELKQRSMNNVLDKIFSFMNVGDVICMGCVSRQWREVVNENSKSYQERTKFVQFMNSMLKSFDENELRYEVISFLNLYRKENIMNIDNSNFVDLHSAFKRHLSKMSKQSISNGSSHTSNSNFLSVFHSTDTPSVKSAFFDLTNTTPFHTPVI